MYVKLCNNYSKNHRYPKIILPVIFIVSHCKKKIIPKVPSYLPLNLIT